MNFGLLDTLNLLGALGFFIYGMKIMSESIQKVAGSKLREFLRNMTSNRAKGVATGFLITSLIQSSSATTVLVVSFVNAGLLSLMEAIGVIMGANIGTTMTAWLLTFVGFKVSISKFALPLIAIAFPLTFFSKEKVKTWAEVFVGFALLLLGLQFLKDGVPSLQDHPEVLEFLSTYTNLGILSTLLFVLIGTIITVVVQSSSAAMALTLVMANQGWIPFEIAVALVLGENIGTTITANIAALIGNVHAKRAALAHFVFNVFGVIWIVILLKPFLVGVDWLVTTLGSTSAYNDAEAIKYALSTFHTTFNIINTLLLVWFAGLIAKIVTKLVKGNDDNEYKLQYISTGLMKASEISIEQARKETAYFGTVIAKMSNEVMSYFEALENDKQEKPLKKVIRLEDHSDQLEEEIAEFLQKISSNGSFSKKTVTRVSMIYSAISELERIGDIYHQMIKDVNKRVDSGVPLPHELILKIEDFFKLIKSAEEVMIKNLDDTYDNANLDLAREKEIEINRKKKALIKEKINLDLESKKLNYKTTSLYKDIIHSLEKAGDHILSVTEAIIDPQIEHIEEEKVD